MYISRNYYGLSARQQTINHLIRNNFRPDGSHKIILIIAMIIIGILVTACKQETSGQEIASLEPTPKISPDTIYQPNINIRVDRRYNEKGELVGIDSTYSSFYSNIQGDTSIMDSLMKGFDAYFQGAHSKVFDREFNSLFFTDSLRYPDFFHDDFFMKRYELNDNYLRDMMRRMDSVKNRFYKNAPRDPVTKKSA